MKREILGSIATVWLARCRVGSCWLKANPDAGASEETTDCGAPRAALSFDREECSSMKAMAVFPRKPNSIHLAELDMPTLDQVPDGRGVLVKVLRVGVDGTDKEINEGAYAAP